MTSWTALKTETCRFSLQLFMCFEMLEYTKAVFTHKLPFLFTLQRCTKSQISNTVGFDIDPSLTCQLPSTKSK